jgi:quercetin dioxygenase-like cupin family protein
VSKVTATWSGAGEGEQLWFLGTLAIVRIAGEASNGRFALIEFLFPRNASPPLHTHPQDESYIVQEGRLTLQAGEQRIELVAGAAAVVPMGVAHTFRVDSEKCAGPRPQYAGRARASRTRGVSPGYAADTAAERDTAAFA